MPNAIDVVIRADVLQSFPVLERLKKSVNSISFLQNEKIRYAGELWGRKLQLARTAYVGSFKLRLAGAAALEKVCGAVSGHLSHEMW